MMIEPTEEMLRAGQEALFEVCPEYTIEEREDVVRKVWAAMEAEAGVFGGTPKREAEHNGIGEGCYLAVLIRERRTLQEAYKKALDEAIALDQQRLGQDDPLMERINRSGPFEKAP